MFIIKLTFIFLMTIILGFISAGSAWAWGPAVHTVIACRLLEETSLILPAIAQILRAYPLEYLYGSLSADFFIGKGQKPKSGHSHNWEAGYIFLNEARDDRQAAYACGFLSHLAADVVAHNYFVPNLIRVASTWKRLGHIYWEAKADHFVGPAYTRMAREVLKTEQPDCDDLLRVAVQRHKTLKARRHVYKQSVKISDYLSQKQQFFQNPGRIRYQISHQYLGYMIGLSFRLVKHFMAHPYSSPCLSHDPIGSRNLRLAGQKLILSKLLSTPQSRHHFPVDEELLRL
ncbi:zinc dependent phospholipase C family protein [Thermodesulfobacteriota bacterium]